MKMESFNTDVTESLIPSYQEGWVPNSTSREDYIKASIIADTPREVKTAIDSYIKHSSCIPAVSELLVGITRNLAILSKTKVVKDLSYRNCKMVIKPDGFINTTGAQFQPYRGNDVEMVISFFVARAETLFITLSTETWAETNAWNRAFRK